MILKTIELIQQKSGLNSYQSPCINLPYEKWENIDLLTECQKCQEKIKLNPFIAE
jgi:hypothetical protein